MWLSSLSIPWQYGIYLFHLEKAIPYSFHILIHVVSFVIVAEHKNSKLFSRSESVKMMAVSFLAGKRVFMEPIWLNFLLIG